MFEKIPTKILVRAELSKNNRQYVTFLCDEGCEYLKEYLEWRMSRGEKLTPDSPVITPLQSGLAGNHIRTTNIGDMMKKPIRAAGLDFRPYNLKRYFLTRLMMAEADGLIIRDYRLFCAGHTSDIQHTYTVNKGLTDDVVEKMRDAYEKAADKYLITRKQESVSQDTVIATFSRRFQYMAIDDRNLECWGEYYADSLRSIGDDIDSVFKEMVNCDKRKCAASDGLSTTISARMKKNQKLKDWKIDDYRLVFEQSYGLSL